MRKSISELNVDEQEGAYLLLQRLVEHTIEERFTQMDYFQMARIAYNLGELAAILDYSKDIICSHYQTASHYLAKGGIDLSLLKWSELLSLRIARENGRNDK